MRGISVGVALLASIVLGIGCGDDDDGAAGGGGGDSGGKAKTEVKAFWIYTGPEDDAGYNVQIGKTQSAMDELDGVETSAIFEAPFSQRATQITKQAIAQGNNMIIETLGLGALFTDPCKQAPDVYCYVFGDPATPPDNTRSFWHHEWDLNYTAGVAAGLMTKTDEIGFIGSFDIPLIRLAVNTFTLGCQSVNPDCKTRAVYTNSYFDPKKDSQAARSLIDAGSDVIRNWVDSSGFCQVAQEEGVYAVGNFADFKEACPDSIITSTPWDYQDYFVEQTKAIQNGTFEGGGIDLIEVGNGPGQPYLADFGEFVPDDVRKQTEDVWAGIVDGDEPIVGPIRDQKGKIRFKDGEEVPHKFMFSEWKWYVEGVVAN
jgi:basic membrane protein A